MKKSIKVKRKIIFLNVNISIINHLGKNPKKGGNPPNDKKTIKIIRLKKKLIFFK